MSGQAAFFVLASFVVAVCARVARLPEPGESLATRELTVEAGGKGFNVAAGLCRLGCRVDGVLPTGDDPISAVAAGALRDAGLPAGMLRQLPGPTGAGIGLIELGGENRIVVHPGANAALDAAGIDAEVAGLCRAGWVIASFEIGDAAILRAFGHGRAAGARTVLNPSPFRPVPLGLLALSDVVVVNLQESRLLSQSIGIPQDRLAAHLHMSGVDAVIVTRGAAGASLHLADGVAIHQPAFATEALDTIGAGDAFLAGLCAWRASGADWRDALRAGCACGAIVAGRSGVLGALPDRREVEARLAGS